MYAIQTTSASKANQYQQLLPQLQALIAADADILIATLANVCAVLKEQFNWFWVGFYLVNDSRSELILAPFQGPLACTRTSKRARRMRASMGAKPNAAGARCEPSSRPHRLFQPITIRNRRAVAQRSRRSGRRVRH